jgi:hypothetical protein
MLMPFRVPTSDHVAQNALVRRNTGEHLDQMANRVEGFIQRISRSVVPNTVLVGRDRDEMEEGQTREPETI